MSRKVNEIGSEFWIESSPETLLANRDGYFCLSGRTAIDLILQDILRKRPVRDVYMPAWCCNSMLAPFLDRGVEVRFYDIAFEDRLVYQIDLSKHVDVFYLTNYFGFESAISLEMVKKIKDQGSIILYDRTHAFLMEDLAYRDMADYSFASIRKWMGVISGAIVEGVERRSLKDCPYTVVKEKAMCDKYSYLMGKDIGKELFLTAFREFDSQLTGDYRNYAMDDLSYTLYRKESLQDIKRRRKENATYIYENLKGLQFVCDYTSESAPLFVPVLFEDKGQRDFVRNKMIKEQIYCPVHWPKPHQIPDTFRVNDLVDRELSLLCDQRYSIAEISREVDTIMNLI